jgi:hypothetical protein
VWRGRTPLRYVVEQDGYGEEPEWGAISDPAGYKALKSIEWQLKGGDAKA